MKLVRKICAKVQSQCAVDTAEAVHGMKVNDMSENKYTMYIQLGTNKELDNRILNRVIEDALLLYQAKANDKLSVATMTVYQDFIPRMPQSETLPMYNQKG